MAGIAERIREARGRRSRQAVVELLKAHGVSVHRNTVEKYEKADSGPSAEFVAAFCDALGVAERWLLSGEGPMFAGAFEIETGTATGMNQIGSVLDGSALSDFVLPKPLEGPAEADSTGDLALRVRWFDDRELDPAVVRILRSPDQTMEPLIRRGDLVLVDTSVDRIDRPGIYVLDVHDAAMIRNARVSARGDVVLMAEHFDYAEEVLTPEEARQLFVVGRIRAFLKTT